MQRRGRAQPAKGQRKNKPKTRKTPTASYLQQQVVALSRELRDEREQRTAAADLLNVISRSAFDLQTVLDTLAESATQLCDADYAWLLQRNGEIFRWLASSSHATDVLERIKKHFETHVVSVDQGSVVGRSALEAKVIHVTDVLADPEYAYGAAQKIGNYRAALGVPLLSKEGVVGAIFVAKIVPQPFTERQIELVTNFAAQAVIAIENTRLLNELRESLQQQTATADVLKVISASPSELQPVFHTMLENAVRFCEAKFAQLFLYDEDKNHFRVVGTLDLPPAWAEYLGENPVPASPLVPLGRAATTKQPVHIEDITKIKAYIEGFPHW